MIELFKFLDMSERMRIIELALDVLFDLNYVRDIYLFGSTLSGDITGSSDIDLLIIVDYDVKKAYMEMSLLLESKLGEEAYNIDLHVANAGERNNPPYKWFISKGKKLKARKATLD